MAKDPSTAYALEPQALGVIETIVDGIKPALRFTGGGIDHDHATLHLCPDPETEPCFTLRLDHPSGGCSKGPWGQFCAGFPDGEPSPRLVAIIAEAVAGAGDAHVWTEGRTIAAAKSQRALAETATISAALVLVPLAVGWGIGAAGRRRLRGRRRTTWVSVACLVAPPVFAVALDARLVLVGAWDALWIGALTGGGALCGLHAACVDWKPVALMLSSCIASLCLVEGACRWVLPPPPAFPPRSPTLLLSNALETVSHFSLACHAIYGATPEMAAQSLVAFPTTWHARRDARYQVLHLGDSMVQGSVTEGRFTDDLEKIEPDVEHVNAAIGGTGPDVYVSILRRFLAKHTFTAVVMHLTGNDLDDVDRPFYPCSGWKPLLTYTAGGTRLRFPESRSNDFETRRFLWQSPPPYVVRACVPFSRFAAGLAAAMTALSERLASGAPAESDALREAHVTAILRDARDELLARHIPLVVDVFRARLRVEHGTQRDDDPENILKHIAEHLGIVTLDTWDPLVSAVRRGARPFTDAAGPTDSHFNPTGHALIAAWLHHELPEAIDRARRLLPPDAGASLGSRLLSPQALRLSGAWFRLLAGDRIPKEP